MRRGTLGHVVEPRESTRRVGSAQVERTLAGGTRLHADARVVPCGRGAGIWRAHGLVGPGNRIGAVAQ